MPRIAALFEYPSLNGGERSLLAVAERLGDRFELVALAPPGGLLTEALRQAGFELAPSPLFDARGERLPRLAALAKLIEIVQRIGPDLLHGNSLAMGRLTGAAARQLDVPCTAHLRDIVGLSAAAIDDLNGNRRLIAVSEATRAFHIGQGLDPERVAVVHNGVDLIQFRPGPRTPKVRDELGISRDALVTLTVGQIGLRKGWDVLADAVAQIAERFPTLHVLLAGERYSDKPETVAYERSVREQFAAALAGRALFLGYRDDMPSLMSAADLLVHPARQEPFGRVLLEAAAAGLPIVATSVGGTEELLENDVSALLVPPGDPTALATAMAAALSDLAQRSHLASAARRRVEAGFSAESAAKGLAAIWEGACTGPRP
jgi:glycosyltransferase involved in cell wall biosynthesis